MNLRHSPNGVHFLYLVLLLCAYNTIGAQRTYTYGIYGYGDTTRLYVECMDYIRNLYYEDTYAGQQTVPGFAHTETYVDLQQDSVWQYSFFDDEHYCTAWRLSRDDMEWDTQRVDRHTVLYLTYINSNKMEFLMSDKYKEEVSPLTNYGRLPGTLVEFRRNGQVYMKLEKVEKRKSIGMVFPVNVKRISGRELNNLKQQKMILTTRVFDSVQLYWGDEHKWSASSLPYDTVVHFAGGTVALKRMHLDTLPAHYQLFAELHQRSNGDAYDRTGSIFIIPQGREHTFFEGMRHSPDSLPITLGRDGKQYQGIRATEDYLPIVEMVRFFTPFGVNHFNDRVQLDGLEWADEAYYKQEVTDLMPLLQGEVWIGAFIGNYDRGGHIIDLDLKAYPNSEIWSFEDNGHRLVMPLFSTCNVLEMAGQTYGTLFGTDTLSVEFDLPEGCTSVRLRYILTGHGGWDTGDEFVPKQSHITIDGRDHYYYTPWRSDCATFRELNPVSGNFWNGTSSCDYSRSGWCPGTATQPVYFDLTGLAPGHHTLTLAIPQGDPVEGGFSHWNASGCLIIEK